MFVFKTSRSAYYRKTGLKKVLIFSTRFPGAGGDGRPADTNKPEAFLTAARPGVPPPWLGVAAPKCCSPPPIHNKIYPCAHFWNRLVMAEWKGWQGSRFRKGQGWCWQQALVGGVGRRCDVMNRAIVGTPDLKSGHRDVPPPCTRPVPVHRVQSSQPATAPWSTPHTRPFSSLSLSYFTSLSHSKCVLPCKEFGTVWNFIFLTTDKDVLLERHQREKERETGGRWEGRSKGSCKWWGAGPSSSRHFDNEYKRQDIFSFLFQVEMR